MTIFFVASAFCFLLALLGLVVGLSPKPWRRRYQSLFEQRRTRRINRNKRIDEAISTIAMRLTVVMLLSAMLLAVAGIFGPKFSSFFDPPPPRPAFPGAAFPGSR